jgi:NAD(P)-dependent dehydrogenase (short-subunit alcohol dehydrogenase family)
MGKNFLITGGASGIGLATARLLQQLGAQVVVWDANPSTLEKCADELDIPTICVDVTEPDLVAEAMQQTVAQLGSLYGVLNSAGIMRTGLLEALDPRQQKLTIDVNVTGSVLTAHAAIPHLKQTRGSLVFMGSVAAFYGTPEFATYAATKAAVLSLAQALRIELQDHGIHVGVVNPHFVNTPMMDEKNRETRFAQSHSIFVTTHTPEGMARTIVQGIAARKFNIVPSWREQLIYWLSRYADFNSHRLMRMTWKRG